MASAKVSRGERQYVSVFGTFTDGFRFVGPFDNGSDALAFGVAVGTRRNMWWQNLTLRLLLSPDQYSYPYRSAGIDDDGWVVLDGYLDSGFSAFGVFAEHDEAERWLWHQEHNEGMVVRLINKRRKELVL